MDDARTRTRLLLVEDDRDHLEVLSMMLGEKYAVFGYTSAAEALQAIDAAKPHVLVLDIGMYPMDGLQCLATIRARPGYRDVPAVALTGFARDVERERFIGGGFHAVVNKPMDDGELMAVIDRLVNSSASAATQLDGRVAATACMARGSGATVG